MKASLATGFFLLLCSTLQAQLSHSEYPLAWENWNSGNYRAFIAATDSAEDVLSEAAFMEIEYFRGLAFDRVERPVKAVNAFKNVLKVADQPEFIARASFQIGEIYFDQKSYANALEFYADALRNYESSGNKSAATNAQFKTAVIHSRRGNAEMAQSLLKRIIHQDSVDPVKKGIAQAELGKVYFQLASFDSARHYLQTSNDQFRSLGMEGEQLDNLEYILQCYHSEGRNAEAMAIAENAVAIAIENGDRQRAAHFFHRLSRYFSEENNTREALHYAELGKEYMDALTSEGKLALLYDLADLYAKNGQVTEALLAFHEAETAAKANYQFMWQERLARRKAGFFDTIGRIDEAYASLKLADSLSEANHRTELSLVKRQLGTAKFTEEMYPKVETDLRSSNETDLFSRLQNIVIIGLIFFTIITLLLLREFTQKRKLSKVLEWKVYKRTREWRKANKELNTYIYKSSHDLRTPLTSIKSLLRLLEKEEHNASTKKYLGLISSCTDQMDDILLNLSKAVDYKKVDVRVEQIDFNKLRYQLLEKELSNLAGVDVRWNIEEKGAFYSDFKLLKVILYQTIQNAVSYRKGQPDDFCKVSIVTDSDGAEVIIEDNGQGISEKVRDKVFDMFVKGTHRSTGAGLGLYLVRIAIEKVRGKIQLHTVENEGSKLTFYLPNLN